MTIPILDTHQHLIYADKWRYSWTDDIPALANKSFTHADYRKLVTDKGDIRAIFMETAPDDPDWHAETPFALGLAADPTSNNAGAIVNCRPEADADFEVYIATVKHPKLCGMRRILHVMPDETALAGWFVENVRHLAAHDLTFDLCFLARQLPVAFEFAKQLPGNKLILDHCGIPEVASGKLDPWRAEIKRLASLPHVACKISGVIAYCDKAQATTETVRPYVEHVIETFGWDRVVWGSDWPVCEMTVGLPAWIDISRELVSGASADEQHKLFHSNAERIYLRQC